MRVEKSLIGAACLPKTVVQAGTIAFFERLPEKTHDYFLEVAIAMLIISTAKSSVTVVFREYHFAGPAIEMNALNGTQGTTKHERQRLILALPPFITCMVSSIVTMLVSPRVV